MPSPAARALACRVPAHSPAAPEAPRAARPGIARGVAGWVLATGLLCACAPPPAPVYDATLNLQALPIEPGAFAGTFALKVVAANLIRVPVPGIGDQLGGGINTRLVTRTWHPESGTYLQESKLCSGANFEVAGVNTSVPAETYAAVPRSVEEVVTLDHERGTYAAAGHVQLWGIDLPEPLATPLPADAEEAARPPHAERIFDMDDDGQPGITLYVSGIFNGQIWAVQRKRVDLEGLVMSPDRALGFSRNRYETVVLGDDILLYDADMGATEPWPDPKESWFEEVRIEEGSTCDHVRAAEAEGKLSRLRPF